MFVGLNPTRLAQDLRKFESAVCYSIFPENMAKEFHLKRKQDRLTWCARYLKRDLINAIPTESRTKIMNRFMHRFKDKAILDYHNLETLKHYLTQDIQGIHDIVFGSKSFSVLVDEMEKAESAYLKRIGDSQRFLKKSGTEIVRVSDSLRWFDLNTHQSKDEGRSLGHCGNTSGSRNDTILSLRSKMLNHEGEEVWVPHCTFILDKSTGQLGERKGRFNQKPNNIFHDAIIQLLIEHKHIIGLNGNARYLSHNDFSLNDLTKDQLDRIKLERPEMFETGYPGNANYSKIANNLSLHFKAMVSASGAALSVNKSKLAIMSTFFEQAENSKVILFSSVANFDFTGNLHQILKSPNFTTGCLEGSLLGSWLKCLHHSNPSKWTDSQIGSYQDTLQNWLQSDTTPKGLMHITLSNWAEHANILLDAMGCQFMHNQMNDKDAA